MQVYQTATGAKGKGKLRPSAARQQPFAGTSGGRLRGGLTVKTVALVDALGNHVRFMVLPGQAHAMKDAAPLIRDISLGALMADKAFDANGLSEELDERGASAVIPQKTNCKHQRDDYAEAFKWLHLVENDFAKIKEFKGIATHYDKTDCSYTASWNLAAALIASGSMSKGPSFPYQI